MTDELQPPVEGPAFPGPKDAADGGNPLAPRLRDPEGGLAASGPGAAVSTAP